MLSIIFPLYLFYIHYIKYDDKFVDRHYSFFISIYKHCKEQINKMIFPNDPIQ